MLKAVPIFLSCHSLISFSINCPPPKITYIFIAALWTVLLDCQANTSSPKYHDENTKTEALTFQGPVLRLAGLGKRIQRNQRFVIHQISKLGRRGASDNRKTR